MNKFTLKLLCNTVGFALASLPIIASAFSTDVDLDKPAAKYLLSGNPSGEKIVFQQTPDADTGLAQWTCSIKPQSADTDLSLGLKPEENYVSLSQFPQTITINKNPVSVDFIAKSSAKTQKIGFSFINLNPNDKSRNNGAIFDCQKSKVLDIKHYGLAVLNPSEKISIMRNPTAKNLYIDCAVVPLVYGNTIQLSLNTLFNLKNIDVPNEVDNRSNPNFDAELVGTLSVTDTDNPYILTLENTGANPLFLNCSLDLKKGIK